MQGIQLRFRNLFFLMLLTCAFCSCAMVGNPMRLPQSTTKDATELATPKWITIEIVDETNEVLDRIFLNQSSTGRLQYNRASVGQTHCCVVADVIDIQATVKKLFSESLKISNDPNGTYRLRLNYCDSFGVFSIREVTTSSRMFQANKHEYPLFFNVVDKTLYGLKINRGVCWHLTEEKQE